jgi:hypothetical protein
MDLYAASVLIDSSSASTNTGGRSATNYTLPLLHSLKERLDAPGDEASLAILRCANRVTGT